MSGYYLLDRRRGPVNWYVGRRNRVKACVVHITAGLEALSGQDQSAERTARYAATTERRVSWHSGSDSDSWLRLLPDSYTAFHVQNYNSSTIGHEISKTDTDWTRVPGEWVERSLSNAAACLRPRLRALGIPIRRATRAELDAAIRSDGPPVGLVAHSELDPQRRSDPGRTFPWARFLELLANGHDDERDDQEDNDVHKVITDGERHAIAALPLRLGDVGYWREVPATYADTLSAALPRVEVNAWQFDAWEQSCKDRGQVVEA